MGLALLDRVIQDLGDVGTVENRSGLQGRFATMVMAPKAGASG